MLRIFCSCGLAPAVFWESTFDEVLSVIKGKVDDWRIQRQGVWGIMAAFIGSKDMPPIYGIYSLPYDDEIIKAEKEQQQRDIELYHQAVAQFDNIIWSKDGK